MRAGIGSVSTGAATHLAAHQAAQALAAAGKPRHHGADGDAQRAAHVRVGHVLERDQQHHLALLGRERQQRALHVDHVHRGHRGDRRGEHVLVDLDLGGDLARLELVHENVVHDREEPCAQVARAPQVEFAHRPLERVLHQVVRAVAIAHERARVAAQIRDVGDDEVVVHGREPVNRRNQGLATCQTLLKLSPVRSPRFWSFAQA